MEKQHLIWKSVELENKVKIGDYNLTSGATLQLVTAMRGGPLNIRRGNERCCKRQLLACCRILSEASRLLLSSVPVSVSTTAMILLLLLLLLRSSIIIVIITMTDVNANN